MVSESINEPFNTAGMEFVEVDVNRLGVMEWHPLPNGEGDPTQVHVVTRVKGSDIPFILRFKSPRTLDKFTAALAVHRRNVWGND